jgi:hypothetical protein
MQIRKFVGLSAALAITLATMKPVAAQSNAGWETTLDARVFAQYMRSGTLRGADGVGSANWFMASASHQGEQRTLSANLMFSLEPVTLGECGYPRLLTPGFICFEHALEDRQHTHPLIMGINASLEQHIGSVAVTVGPGLAGEPAFGPTVYFHRRSAAYDPISPLTHDRFSPVHTAYGLVNAAIESGRLRLEGSVFNGTAHDDDAYDLDLAPMHSYSGRAQVSFGSNALAQFSVGSLQPSPGGGHHGGGDERMTVYSATLESAPSSMSNLAYTLGVAAHRMAGETEYSGLAELLWSKSAHSLFARAELTERVEYDVLIVVDSTGVHQHTEIPRHFNLGEVAAGYTFRMPVWRGIETSIGARASVNTIPSYLRPRYDASRGFAFAFFTSIRPAQHHNH